MSIMPRLGILCLNYGRIKGKKGSFRSLFSFAFLSLQVYNKAMYLVSLYFDEKTNQKIRGFMECAAKKSGNTDMTDKDVPPHITLTAFESALCEDALIEVLSRVLCGVKQHNLMWVSVGTFFSKTLFLAPVLNEHLLRLSDNVGCALTQCENTELQECYRPFAWFPHTTVARRLSGGEMAEAFAALQKSFSPFEGTIVRIGLSAGSPKRELASWDLLSEKEEFET